MGKKLECLQNLDRHQTQGHHWPLLRKQHFTWSKKYTQLPSMIKPWDAAVHVLFRVGDYSWLGCKQHETAVSPCGLYLSEDYCKVACYPAKTSVHTAALRLMTIFWSELGITDKSIWKTVLVQCVFTWKLPFAVIIWSRYMQTHGQPAVRYTLRNWTARWAHTFHTRYQVKYNICRPVSWL